VTPKFTALRDLFIKNLKIDPLPIPADPSVIEIPAFRISNHRSLLANLPKATLRAEDVVTMEDVGQAYGLILYRKRFTAGLAGNSI